MLSDLSPSMPPGWQAIDLSVRSLKIAMRSADFQRTPAVVAVVQSVTNTLEELVARRVGGTSGPAEPRGTREVSAPNEGDSVSSDADAQPSQSSGGEPADGS
jgi:hypothetical protein